MSFITTNDSQNSSFIKTPEEIEKMRVAGRLTAQVLEAVASIVKPGVTTGEIDNFCERYIIDTLKATPGSKGQYGYPYTVNTSVNKIVCHGVPSSTQILNKGDIVNVDVTVIKDGYYGDSSKTFCVGPVAAHAQRLVDVTQQCLYEGIKKVKPDATLGDIGHAIQIYAEKHGYSVVREYCGHGIGKKMHEDPQILHYGTPGKGLKLQAGMTFTIEPMINQGKAAIKSITKDNWTIVMTADRRLSAQWEHTILVTETGFEILTLRDEEKEILNSLIEVVSQ
jgi:methionyl aminopeptidase